MGMVSPAPSDGETYKVVEVEWRLPLAIVQEPCPAASAASPVKRDQARCLRMVQNVPTVGSVDLRGAKYGNIYAWIPKGAQAPLVILGGRQLDAQFPANDSTARVCTPQSTDCNVIWVPISVNFKVDDTDGALAALSFVASGPSETYPDVNFALFENITLAYPASPASLSIDGTTGTGSGDLTSSLFSTSSNPLVPISTATGSGDATSSLTSTSQPAPSDVLRKHRSKGILVGIIVSVATLSAMLLSLFLRRRRKRRRQDTSYPEADPASDVTPFPIAAAPSIPEHPSDGDGGSGGGSGARNDEITAAINIMSKSPSEPADIARSSDVRDGDGGGGSGAHNDKITAALDIMSKSPSEPADIARSGAPPAIEQERPLQLPADELYASPSILPASPGQVAQLTAALYRVGLSVNELMNSLDRVSRLEVDVNHDSSQRTTDIEAEVLPPRYEA